MSAAKIPKCGLKSPAPKLAYPRSSEHHSVAQQDLINRSTTSTSAKAAPDKKINGRRSNQGICPEYLLGCYCREKVFRCSVSELKNVFRLNECCNEVNKTRKTNIKGMLPERAIFRGVLPNALVCPEQVYLKLLFFSNHGPNEWVVHRASSTSMCLTRLWFRP